MTVTTYAAWNSADKDANVSLSGRNLTASGPFGDARATQGKSSGKWYWELTCTTLNTTFLSGIGDSSQSLSNSIGNDVHGYGYRKLDGKTFHAAATAVYGASYASGDIISIALDMDAGTLEFFKNNATQGVAFSGISGTYFPMVGASSTTFAITANFGASAFNYTPPTGYNPGLYTLGASINLTPASIGFGNRSGTPGIVTMGFGLGGVTPIPPVVAPTGGGGKRKRKHGRVIKWSDLDERERIEALAAIPVKPFDKIERAAVALGNADEEDIDNDDAILMAVVTRLLH